MCGTWLTRQCWKDQHYLINVSLHRNYLTHLLSELNVLWCRFLFSLRCINIAMVTILKNVTNIITAVGELYLFRKGQNPKVWTAMFLMVNDTCFVVVDILLLHKIWYHCWLRLCVWKAVIFLKYISQMATCPSWSCHEIFSSCELW